MKEINFESASTHYFTILPVLAQAVTKYINFYNYCKYLKTAQTIFGFIYTKQRKRITLVRFHKVVTNLPVSLRICFCYYYVIIIFQSISFKKD